MSREPRKFPDAPASDTFRVSVREDGASAFRVVGEFAFLQLGDEVRAALAELGPHAEVNIDHIKGSNG